MHHTVRERTAKQLLVNAQLLGRIVHNGKAVLPALRRAQRDDACAKAAYKRGTHSAAHTLQPLMLRNRRLVSLPVDM